MKYNITRDLILKSRNIAEVLDLLADSDREMRKHLDTLLIQIWDDGYDDGYNQGMLDSSRRTDYV
jgi:hypothetical protein